MLVRRRGPLFEAIIRALKNASIPVAGADRLVLTEHIAVMDLMVLADAILLPEDDLALATTEVDLSPISEGQSITVIWRGKPVFIRKRTPGEIAEAKKSMGGDKDPQAAR